MEDTEPRGYFDLVAEHRNKKGEPLATGSILSFAGVEEGKDAYNPSGPFVAGDQTYQWARVESRKAQDSEARLFKKTAEGTYEPVEGSVRISCEDPFIQVINGEFVVGGVEISKDERGVVVGFRTIFYRGHTMDSLEKFTTGPEDMKDIRLAVLPSSDGTTRILVFTRPFIPIGARMMGRVGMTIITTLDELTAERLHPEQTDIFRNQFVPTEWGGVNDVYVFEDGIVGALCHIAAFDEQGKRHYAAGAFVMDTKTKKISPLEVIAERRDFPNAPTKVMPENLDNPAMFDDLADVVFSSRLSAADGNMRTAETLELTCGLSDAAIGSLVIANPFPGLIERHLRASQS